VIDNISNTNENKNVVNNMLTSIKGPIVWALIAEIYPSRYRATAMGLA